MEVSQTQNKFYQYQQSKPMSQLFHSFEELGSDVSQNTSLLENQILNSKQVLSQQRKFNPDMFIKDFMIREEAKPRTNKIPRRLDLKSKHFEKAKPRPSPAKTQNDYLAEYRSKLRIQEEQRRSELSDFQPATKKLAEPEPATLHKPSYLKAERKNINKQSLTQLQQKYSDNQVQVHVPEVFRTQQQSQEYHPGDLNSTQDGLLSHKASPRTASQSKKDVARLTQAKSSLQESAAGEVKLR